MHEFPSHLKRMARRLRIERRLINWMNCPTGQCFWDRSHASLVSVFSVWQRLDFPPNSQETSQFVEFLQRVLIPGWDPNLAATPSWTSPHLSRAGAELCIALCCFSYPFLRPRDAPTHIVEKPQATSWSSVKFKFDVKKIAWWSIQCSESSYM